MGEPDSHPTASLFPPTHWSVLLSAGRGTSDEAAAALAEFCRTYWYPLYAFARRTGCSPEDAEDLTQGFFAHLLESGLLVSADSARGRFRSFLLQSFRNYQRTQHARTTAAKRHASRQMLSLDADGAEARFGREMADVRSPELVYERNWAVAVLEEAMSQLRREFEQAGRAQTFDTLHPFLNPDDAGCPYSAVARELATTESTARVMVHRLRRRYRRALEAVVLRTVSSALEVKEELRYLLRVLQT